MTVFHQASSVGISELELVALLADISSSDPEALAFLLRQICSEDRSIDWLPEQALRDDVKSWIATEVPQKQSLKFDRELTSGRIDLSVCMEIPVDQTLLEALDKRVEELEEPEADYESIATVAESGSKRRAEVFDIDADEFPSFRIAAVRRLADSIYEEVLRVQLVIECKLSKPKRRPLYKTACADHKKKGECSCDWFLQPSLYALRWRELPDDGEAHLRIVSALVPRINVGLVRNSFLADLPANEDKSPLLLSGEPIAWEVLSDELLAASTTGGSWAPHADILAMVRRFVDKIGGRLARNGRMTELLNDIGVETEGEGDFKRVKAGKEFDVWIMDLPEIATDPAIVRVVLRSRPKSSVYGGSLTIPEAVALYDDLLADDLADENRAHPEGLWVQVYDGNCHVIADSSHGEELEFPIAGIENVRELLEIGIGAAGEDAS